MKNFILTVILTAIIFGQGCWKNDTVHVANHLQNTIKSRDYISDLVDTIAKDPIFERLVETVFDYVILVDGDYALADSITAFQFFHNSNDSICLNISQFDSLLTVYNFSEKNVILSNLNKIIATVTL